MGKFNTAAAEEAAAKASKLGFQPQEDDTMEGFEEITQATMAIPFVRILQKLSPQLDKQEAAYLEEAEEGDFFNTISKEVYGPSLECIVLKFEHIYIEWRPDRGGFAGYHSVENAERITVDKTFGKWKTPGGNLLSETYTYLALIVGHEEEGIIVLAFSSSMIKMAREWNRLMTTHIFETGQRAMPYYLVWNIQTEYKSNEKGNWYIPIVNFSKYVGPIQYQILQRERKILPSRQVDYTQLQGGTEQEEKFEENTKF